MSRVVLVLAWYVGLLHVSQAQEITFDLHTTSSNGQANVAAIPEQLSSVPTMEQTGRTNVFPNPPFAPDSSVSRGRERGGSLYSPSPDTVSSTLFSQSENSTTRPDSPAITSEQMNVASASPPLLADDNLLSNTTEAPMVNVTVSVNPPGESVTPYSISLESSSPMVDVSSSTAMGSVTVTVDNKIVVSTTQIPAVEESQVSLANSSKPSGSRKKELTLGVSSLPTTATPTRTSNRHRPDPGLASTDFKQSTRRNGVPDPDMLDSPSKARKGVDEHRSTELTPSTGTPMSSTPAYTARAHFPIGPGLSEQLLAPPTVLGRHSSTSLVVGVLLLLCLVAAAAVFAFRRFRHSWGRRHYRKMDFLVDGMYNL